MSGAATAAAERNSFAGKRAAPGSVALVGASSAVHGNGLILNNLRDYGFAGRFIWSTPAKEVFGLPCYPSLRETPNQSTTPWSSSQPRWRMCSWTRKPPA